MRNLLFLVPLLLSQDPDLFVPIGGAHGVAVYRRMQAPTIDLKAEGDIDAPPDVVRAIVLDYEGAAGLSDHVAESTVLSNDGRELVVYQRLDLPVIADRDYTLRARWGEHGETLWTRFAVDNTPGPAEREGVVRVSTLDGGWDLQPLREGRATHAIYHVEIDLAGSIPRWMVSGGAAKDLPRLFESLRRRAQRAAADGSE